MPVNRRDAIKILGTAALSVAGRSLHAQPRPAAAAPNILFIMTDDQRADALSLAGNKILKTPNMDRIGREGVRFANAFVINALCGPSRASILTGTYSHIHGVVSNGDGPGFRNQPGLPDHVPTFVELLQRAGYYTGIVGKWHLRSVPEGFDSWVIFPGQGAYTDPLMIANGTRIRMRGHADDVVGDQALTFLQERPQNQPFCLLYQFKSPHRNWWPAERFKNVFNDIEIPLPRTFEDKLEGRPEAVRKAEMAIADMPDFREQGVDPSLPASERARLNLQHLVKNYYRVLLSVDENVGRVLDFLDKNGLTENTIVIYTSDNGFFLGEHGMFDKRLMYEPSIRVPMLMRHPARIKASQAESRMVLNIDVAPTLLGMAGVPVAAHMQGRSWMPLLESRPTAWRDAFMYEFYEYPGAHCVRKNRGLRTDRWKLIHYWEQPQEWELYDLRSDPDEMRNLAGDPRYADELAGLKQRLAEVRVALRDFDPAGPAPVAALCHEKE